MNDMKKLSILAAGVAVLSMCACTEANEFTPSTNNSTKKITEIKVSANPSTLGTRTAFDISDPEYVIVTWEKDDELYFFKDNSNPQTFICGEDDNSGPNPDYDWNYFTAKKGAGLDVDSKYYVYYFPALIKNKYTDSRYNYKYSDKVSISELILANNYKYNDGGSEDKVWKTFMSDYDLLMTDASVTAKDPMEEYIYMEHAFAYITVDLLCTNYGDFSDMKEEPKYYETDLWVGDDQNNALFDTHYRIGPTGEIEFTSDGTWISSLFSNDEEYWDLDSQGRDKLKFYFILHPKDAVSKLSFKICTVLEQEGEHQTTYSSSVDKTLVLTFGKKFKFEAGKCYHFGLNVDYDPNNEYKNKPYLVDYWKLNNNYITLRSFPDVEGLSISNVQSETEVRTTDSN